MRKEKLLYRLLASIIIVIISLNNFFCNSSEEEKPISRERYLLLDSRIIEQTENAKLAVGKVKKYDHNPLFTEDKPWEARYDNLYANVLYDEEDGLYKCWYSPFTIDPPSNHTPRDQRKAGTYSALLGELEDKGEEREMGVCYANSKDGLNWEKPELGIVEFNGSTKNNLVIRGPHGAGIFKDSQDSDPMRRYKMFFKGEEMSVAFSANGLEWGKSQPTPEIDAAGDTHNNAFWAPDLNTYIGMTRLWDRKERVRQVGRTISKDFLSWSKANVVLQGLEQDQQTYAMPTFSYADLYLGLVVIFNKKTDRSHTELAWSANTVDWQRIDPGTPLIPNAEKKGDYDWGCVYAAAYPIFENNEIRLYYGGSNGLHTDWRDGFFCLATLRPDGFAGYEPELIDSSAFILTKLLSWFGKTLRLTADIREGGSVRVEILDNKNKRIASGKAVNQSGTDVNVVWQNNNEISSLNKKKIRLKFILDKAKLYSFVVN